MTASDDLATQALADAQTPPAPASPAPKSDPAVAETLTALQNVIERNVLELDRINAQLKEFRDSLKNIFENDADLGEAEDQAAVVTQRVKERKSKIQNSAEALQLKSRITELNEEGKEVKEALSNHLVNLYQMTGAKVIDMSEGQREFDVRASMKGGKKSNE